MDDIRRDLGVGLKDGDEGEVDEDEDEGVSTADMLKVLEERARQNGIPWGYF